MTQPTLATKAALHLRNRLSKPRYASIFDGVDFTAEQSECLLALADAAEAWITAQAQRSSGGKRGGKGRAAKLTAEERSAIAKKGAEKRWNKSG